MDFKAGVFAMGSRRRGLAALVAAAIVAAFALAIAASAQAAPNVALVWGANSSGDLGSVRKIAKSNVPLQVRELTGVTAVAGGEDHSLALLEGGTVMAWGGNESGQLGNGTTTGSPTPVAVSGLKEVTAIGAGERDGAALLSNGTVMTWGLNSHGELGNGTETNSNAPVEVKGLKEVTAIAIGEDHDLALLKNGTVMDWGYGGAGGLGNGTTEKSTLPVAVCAVGAKSPCSEASQQLKEVTAIAAGGGGEHSLALLKNGTVVAWGWNPYGQLGNGTETNSDVPVEVKGLTGVTAIASGRDHSLARLENGTVMAWGDNGSGQLGDATTAGPEKCEESKTRACSKIPVEVTGLTAVKSVTGGSEYSLALLENGTVKAWGTNESGQLGNGTFTSSDVPVQVSKLTGVTAIASGSDSSHSLAVGEPLPGGGESGYGQCGAVKHKTGSYKEGNCQTLAAKKGMPTHKGRFEWASGPASGCVRVKGHGKYADPKCEILKEKKGRPRGKYEKQGGSAYTSTGGEATLETPSLHVTVKCAASTDVGEVTGSTTDVDRVTFTGCEATAQKCTSLEGAKAEGEIVTYALKTELVLPGEVGLSGTEPAAGQVWTEFSNLNGAHAPYLATFECGKGTFFRTRGWLSGVTSGNVHQMSFKSQTAFGAGIGQPNLVTELSPTATFEHILESGKSTLTTTVQNTFASETEIKT